MDNFKELNRFEIFIGLNDKSTYEQIEKKETVIKFYKDYCIKYDLPFSISSIRGGYTHLDGEFVNEESICITLINYPRADVVKLIERLKMILNQESILIFEKKIEVMFI